MDFITFDICSIQYSHLSPVSVCILNISMVYMVVVLQNRHFLHLSLSDSFTRNL